ncbi:hypothetical protein D3C73_1500900 [compost metagenome]
MAEPPIQLPATVAMPRQMASGPAPIRSGATKLVSKRAMGPPSMTPSVPVKNMIRAFGPRRKTAGRSADTVSSTRAAGSRKREAMK